MANNSYVVTITEEQIEQLTSYLQDRGWEFGTAPYAKFRASGDHVSIVLYQSGKLVVQGKGMQEFISFVLEPEILHTFGFGYDLSAQSPPPPIDEHGGIDESGKGDFFGPLVIGGVCVTPQTAEKLQHIGVCDSKLIHSSSKIIKMAAEIRNIAIDSYTTVILMPETYNRLYEQIGNLNRLLAWGHARVIENLLEKVPDCPRMLSDKFGNEALIQRALMERGRKIRIDQAVRAESDVAVAAASILARDGFLRGMSKLQIQIGWELPRGAGPQVKIAGKRLLAERGMTAFRNYAKLHFKTYSELI